ALSFLVGASFLVPPDPLLITSIPSPSSSAPPTQSPPSASSIRGRRRCGWRPQESCSIRRPTPESLPSRLRRTRRQGRIWSASSTNRARAGRAFSLSPASRKPDRLLAWTANPAGTYILQVFGFAYPAISDVKFTGGNACVYRLHLSRGRCLQYTLPLGVQRGVRTKLRLFGWNMGSSPGLEF